MLAAVGRVVDAALVEPHAAVVLTRVQLVGIGWVGGNVLLGLSPEGAVLVHPFVAFALVATRTAERARACSRRVAGETELAARGDVRPDGFVLFLVVQRGLRGHDRRVRKERHLLADRTDRQNGRLEVSGRGVCEHMSRLVASGRSDGPGKDDRTEHCKSPKGSNEPSHLSPFRQLTCPLAGRLGREYRILAIVISMTAAICEVRTAGRRAY